MRRFQIMVKGEAGNVNSWKTEDQPDRLWQSQMYGVVPSPPVEKQEYIGKQHLVFDVIEELPGHVFRRTVWRIDVGST